MRISPIALVSLALLVPATATASDLNERPADARLRVQVQFAVTYWAAQGVTGCPQGIAAHFYRNLMTEDGSGGAQGHASNCQVWVDLGSAREARRANEPRWYRTFSAKIECGLVLHEVGHALGLSHVPAGLMAANYRERDIPRACAAWARGYFPRPLGVTVNRALHSIR